MKAWRWVLPVLVIVALASAARSYAGALGRADAADARAVELTVEIDSIADSNVDLQELLADADSAKAIQARADSVRIAELAIETEALERTVRDLAAADRLAAESVDAALRDLGAVLAPSAMPALRTLQSAYQARITGLDGQIVALTSIVDAKDEEIEILGVELIAERFARSAADELLRGLRVELVVQGEIVETQVIEIDALRDAVAPGFFLRIWQHAELALGAAVFGGAVVYLAVGG